MEFEAYTSKSETESVIEEFTAKEESRLARAAGSSQVAQNLASVFMIATKLVPFWNVEEVD